MCLFIRPLAFARVGGAVDVFNVLGGFFILYLPFFVGFTWFLGLVFSVCVFGGSDRGRGLMPDLWSGSLATRTIGQASVVDAGPMVRVACDPDHWAGIRC